MYCYLLNSGKHTYIGATVDVDKRLDQHNGKISGGAAATRGKTWKRVLYVGGIPDWTTALQVEWAWKNAAKRKHGVDNKIASLLKLLQKERPTRKSLPFTAWIGQLFVHVSAEFAGRAEKIEGWSACFTLDGSLPQASSFRVLPSFNSSFPPPSKMSSSVSSTDFAKLAATVDIMSGEIAKLSSQLKAALDRLAAAPAAAASAAAPAAADGKKVRKPRAKKEKATCPPADEGVIRFFSGGKPEYKFMSNLFKAPFKLHDKEFMSAEHYFQWSKFAETDPEYAEKVRTTKNPVLTKGMGRSKAHPIRENWDSVRVEMMRAAIEAKFEHNPDLAAKLKATGNAKLEEESPNDAFWGIGADGKGENWTGRILMELRDELEIEDAE